LSPFSERRTSGKQVLPPVETRAVLRFHLLDKLAGTGGAASIFLVVYVLVFIRHAPALGLYVDDWGELESANRLPFSVLLRSWPMDYRPFESIPWIVLSRAVGPHLVPYYLLLFSLGYASSLLLFVAIRRLTGEPLFALLSALLYAVSPSDPSVFWLTTFAYRFASAFFLLALVLLIVDTSLPNGLQYLGSLFFAVMCLASNELFLGWLAVLPFIALWRHRCGERTLSVWRAAPFGAIIVLYVAYRDWVGPHVLHLFDNKTGQMQLSPVHILTVWLQGLLVELLGGWYVAVASLLKVTPATGLLIVVLVLTTLIALAGLTAWQVSEASASVGGQGPARAEIRMGIRAVRLGIVAILIGCVPLVFTAAKPSVGWTYARVNAASTWGAALTVIGLLWIVAHGLSKGPSARRLFTGMAFVLVIVAAMQEDRVGSGFANAWSQQRAFWRESLPILAKIHRESTVVLVAPRNHQWDKIGSLPPVGFSSGMAMMLPNSHVDAILWYSQDLRACGLLARHNAGEALLLQAHTNGLQWSGSETVLPYARIVVLLYNPVAADPVYVLNGQPAWEADCPLRGNHRPLGTSAAHTSIWGGVLDP
jgi:hypothetical protein